MLATRRGAGSTRDAPHDDPGPRRASRTSSPRAWDEVDRPHLIASTLTNDVPSVSLSGSLGAIRAQSPPSPSPAAPQSQPPPNRGPEDTGCSTTVSARAIGSGDVVKSTSPTAYRYSGK